MTQTRRTAKFLWDNGKFYGRSVIKKKRELRRPMETNDECQNANIN